MIEAQKYVIAVGMDIPAEHHVTAANAIHIVTENPECARRNREDMEVGLEGCARLT